VSMPEAAPGSRQAWTELARSLGQALLAVLRAEAEALGADLRRSGVHLVRALVLLGGAAAVSFWTLGVLVLVLIAVLAIWLPTWAAALIVAGLFILTAGLLVALAVRHLRRLENPVDDVRRRIADHLDWWQQRLLGGAAAEAPARPPASPAGPAGRQPLPSAARAPQGEPRTPLSPPAGTAPPRIHPDDPLEEDEL
jgi:Putative Actinobacterial Holin-X, holin superfamily III